MSPDVEAKLDEESAVRLRVSVNVNPPCELLVPVITFPFRSSILEAIIPAPVVEVMHGVVHTKLKIVPSKLATFAFAPPQFVSVEAR